MNSDAQKSDGPDLRFTGTSTAREPPISVHATPLDFDITARSAVSFSPTAHDFGSQAVGSSSGSQQFTLTNGGDTAANVSGVSIGGTNPGGLHGDGHLHAHRDRRPLGDAEPGRQRTRQPPHRSPGRNRHRQRREQRRRRRGHIDPAHQRLWPSVPYNNINIKNNINSHDVTSNNTHQLDVDMPEAPRRYASKAPPAAGRSGPLAVRSAAGPSTLTRTTRRPDPRVAAASDRDAAGGDGGLHRSDAANRPGGAPGPPGPGRTRHPAR